MMECLSQSASAAIYAARDAVCDGEPVVLKFMTDEDSFLRETQLRQDFSLSPQYVAVTLTPTPNPKA